MPGEVANGVLQVASSQGPVVLIAALFGFYTLGFAAICFGALVKVLKMHAEKVERLTNSLASAIQTMTEAQGKREERMTDALKENTTAWGRADSTISRLALLRTNGA